MESVIKVKKHLSKRRSKMLVKWKGYHNSFLLLKANWATKSDVQVASSKLLQ